MVTANLTTIVGFSLVAVAVLAVFFSPYRRWLLYGCRDAGLGPDRGDSYRDSDLV